MDNAAVLRALAQLELRLAAVQFVAVTALTLWYAKSDDPEALDDELHAAIADRLRGPLDSGSFAGGSTPTFPRSADGADP